MGWLRQRVARRLAEAIGSEVIDLARTLIEQGNPIAEVRRRLADGISKGEMISDEALERVRDVDESEAKWLASLRRRG